MKNQSSRGTTRCRVPVFLAVLLPILLPLCPAAGAQARMVRTPQGVIEISGGSGARQWTIHYGTWVNAGPGSAFESQFAVDGIRAWLGHGSWLRLIDTQRGVVTGRWHLPGRIVKLTPAGESVQVEVENGLGEEKVLHQTITVDPAHADIPLRPHGMLLLYRVPEREAAFAAKLTPTTLAAPGPAGLLIALTRLTPADKQELLSQYEEAVRRDPVSPWFRIVLGKLLRDAGDARATAVIQDAMQAPSSDFTELLSISTFLESAGEHEEARAAFDRAYRNYFQRGYDPRMWAVLIERLVLYRIEWNKLPADLRPELIERLYRLAPAAEGANFAWSLYADELQRAGAEEQARLWRARAREASDITLCISFPALALRLDYAILALAGCTLALLVYLLVLRRRYAAQSRLDGAARKQEWARESFSLSGFWRYWTRRERLVFWSRGERVALLLLVLLGWFASGLTVVYWNGIQRLWATWPLDPLMGTYGGPLSAGYLQEQLPAGPHRDLLLALAYQQSGEEQKAEPLYRALPQFAESWNNLGVILKNHGKEQEARQAFEQALRLKPELQEASLNLGRPPGSFWTEMHQKFLPGQPMIAPPPQSAVIAATLGGPASHQFLAALAGPFNGLYDLRVVAQFAHSIDEALFSNLLLLTPVLAAYLLMGGLILAIALLTVVPAHEVSQPPGKRHWLLETLFPGTAPFWRGFGGPALCAWCCWLVFLALYGLTSGTGAILTGKLSPSLGRIYGIAVDDDAAYAALLRPSWILVWLAPAILSTVNLALVLWQRRRESSVSVG